MKYIIIHIILFSSLAVHAQYKTLYDFNARTIDGEMYDFSQLKGKKVLIVNTASKCSLTPQLKKLQEIYEEYGGDDFEIIGFPCNDFGKRDPDDNREIARHCRAKHGVSFPLMEKISIKGDNPHPLFKWLTSSEENGTLDAKVTWNFQKFMVDENGQVIDFVPPIKGPQSKKIMEWLMQ